MHATSPLTPLPSSTAAGLRAVLAAALLACAGMASAQPAAAPAAAPGDCNRPVTQAQMNACAYEDFLLAQAELAATQQRLQQGWSSTQRDGLRKVQKAWLQFRTEACAFESSAAAGGSVQPMLQWQCAARMTRERAAALAATVNCPEGDLACVRPAVAR